MIPKLVIEVTGDNFGGKGEFIKILREDFGFQTASISDSLRTIADIIPFPKDSGTLAKIADVLRYGMGSDAMAKVTLRDLKFEKEKVVIDSFRHPAEVIYTDNVLFSLGNTHPNERPTRILVAVRADQEIRFERSKTRLREGDPKTLEEFIAREKNDTENPNEFQQQVKKCIEMANYTIWNNTNNRSDLKKEIEKLLSSIGEGAFKSKERE